MTFLKTLWRGFKQMCFMMACIGVFFLLLLFPWIPAEVTGNESWLWLYLIHVIALLYSIGEAWS